MPSAATVLAPLAALLFLTACRHTPTSAPPAPLDAGVLLPSPRLIVGRIIAVDPARAFAFVELSTDAPIDARAEDSELLCRSTDLRETARLRASRQLRGRILGAKILSGRPSSGDEVVWLAP